MKKIIKNLLLVCLMLVMVVPVFSACKNKDEVVLSVFGQTSLNVKRGGQINFVTNVNGVESAEPEILIIYDTSSNISGESLSAKMFESTMVISKDAVIGSKIQVQAFYKNSTIKSNILEFTIINTDVENIYFEGEGITYNEVTNQYNLSALPTSVINLKSILKISPDFATDDAGLITIDKVAFNVSKINSVTEFYKYTSDVVNKKIEIFDDAVAGKQIEVNALCKDKHATIIITVKATDSTVAFKQKEYNVICGKSFDLKKQEYLSLNIGNNPDHAGKTLSDLNYNIMAGDTNASLSQGILTINKFKNAADIGVTITVEVSGTFITGKASAVFTIIPNELNGITTIHDSTTNSALLNFAEMHDLSNYFKLVGKDIDGDVTNFSLANLIFNVVDVDDAINGSTGIDSSISIISNNKLGIKAFGDFSQNKTYKVLASINGSPVSACDFYFKITQIGTLNVTYTILGENPTITDGIPVYNFTANKSYSMTCSIMNGLSQVSPELYSNLLELYEENGTTKITDLASRGITLTDNTMSFENMTNGEYVFIAKHQSGKTFKFVVNALNGLIAKTNIPNGVIDTTILAPDYKMSFDLYNKGVKSDLSKSVFTLYKKGTKELVTIIKFKEIIFGNAGFGEILPLKQGAESIVAVINYGGVEYTSNAIDINIIMVADTISIKAEGVTANENAVYDYTGIQLEKMLEVVLSCQDVSKVDFDKRFIITSSFNSGTAVPLNNFAGKITFDNYGVYVITVSTLADVANKVSRSITITINDATATKVGNYSELETALLSTSVEKIVLTNSIKIAPTSTIVLGRSKNIDGAGFSLTSDVIATPGEQFDFINNPLNYHTSIKNLTVIGNDDILSNSSRMNCFIVNNGELSLSQVNISKYENGIKNLNTLNITDVVITDMFTTGIYNNNVGQINVNGLGNNINKCGLACVELVNSPDIMGRLTNIT
ncbi:MAG: hypothetical protein RR334_03620, partial [Clostridia bacterium]